MPFQSTSGFLQSSGLSQGNRGGQANVYHDHHKHVSNTVYNADNLKFEYHDADVGKSWDHSGNYANLKYFTVTKQMYAVQKMLGQHGDMSGSWTPEQLKIIREAGLKEK